MTSPKGAAAVDRDEPIAHTHTVTELAGSVGAGKLLVLHPAFGGDPDGLEVAIGIQRTLARMIERCGRPTAFALMRVRVEAIDASSAGDDPSALAVGDMMLGTVEAWPDDAVAPLLASQLGCRFGLVLEFHALGPQFQLAARLLQTDDRGHAHCIAQWSREDDNLRLPALLFELVADIAARTGVSCPWRDAAEMFGTDDAIAVLYSLQALGYCTELEEQCRVHLPHVLHSLGALIEAAPTHAIARDIVESTLLAVARRGANDLELARWLKELRARAGADAWPRLHERLATARAQA